MHRNPRKTQTPAKPKFILVVSGVCEINFVLVKLISKGFFFVPHSWFLGREAITASIAAAYGKCFGRPTALVLIFGAAHVCKQKVL